MFQMLLFILLHEQKLSIINCFNALPFEFQIEILMKDHERNFDDEIDNFTITFPFPSGIQEQEYTGAKGIANITLSSDIMFFDPNACSSTAVSSQLTGTQINLRS